MIFLPMATLEVVSLTTAGADSDDNFGTISDLVNYSETCL